MALVNDLDDIRSVYDPINGFYLLSFPAQASPLIDAVTFVLDQRYPFRDEDTNAYLNIITTWTLAPTSWMYAKDFTLQLGEAAGVGTYNTAIKDNTVAFNFIYQSPWLELGEQYADRLKMLKRIGAILFVRANTEVTFKWSTDFEEGFNQIVREVLGGGDTSEYNLGEWSISQWSGGLSLRIIKVPARDKGQYFRIGIEAEVNGAFAIQQMELFTKMGRLA